MKQASRIVIGAFIVLGGLLLTCTANAFSITPVRYLVTLDPGTPQTVALKIINDGKQDRRFNLKIIGFRQDNEGKAVFEQGIDEAESWVTPEAPAVVVKAGETKQTHFIIRVPAATPAGSHYVGLAIEPANQQGQITSRLVSLLTIQVSGVVEERITITTWNPADGITAEKTWPFSLVLTNHGTIEVALSGAIILKNWRGNEVAMHELRLGNKLLAGSVRTREPAITIPRGIEHVPGLYRAEVRVIYGNTKQIASSLVYVWYVPKWFSIAAIAAAVLIISLIIRALVKQRHVVIR